MMLKDLPQELQREFADDLKLANQPKAKEISFIKKLIMFTREVYIGLETLPNSEIANFITVQKSTLQQLTENYNSANNEQSTNSHSEDTDRVSIQPM